MRPRERVIADAAGRRVVVACFASHIHRVQQVVDAAVGAGRKVATLGRSMAKNFDLAQRLGVLEVPEGSLVDVEDVERLPPGDVCVVSTGSQGEPMSALSLMAAGENKWLQLHQGDVVVISAHPGCRATSGLSGKVIDGLHRRGATVVHTGVEPVHVSGHARQGELQTLLSVARPDWFVPVHGEYRHMVNHAALAVRMGVADDHVLVCEDGDSLVIEDGGIRRGDAVPAGFLYVDGTVGDVGHGVLRDRRVLAEEGVVMVVATVDTHAREVVGSPEIVTRGLGARHRGRGVARRGQCHRPRSPAQRPGRRRPRPRDAAAPRSQGARALRGGAHTAPAHDRASGGHCLRPRTLRCPRQSPDGGKRSFGINESAVSVVVIVVTTKRQPGEGSSASSAQAPPEDPSSPQAATPTRAGRQRHRRPGRPRRRPVGGGPGHRGGAPGHRRLLLPMLLGPVGAGARHAFGDLLGVGRFLVPPASVAAAVFMVVDRPRHDPARSLLGMVLGSWPRWPVWPTWLVALPGCEPGAEPCPSPGDGWEWWWQGRCGPGSRPGVRRWCWWRCRSWLWFCSPG